MASQVSEMVISHWSTLIENFQASPLEFYKAVEAALARRQIPQTQNSRVDYRESGLLSAQREYLRVTREKLLFDVCAAPFGTGFFVSYWLAQEGASLNGAMKAVALFALILVAGVLINTAGVLAGAFFFLVGIFGGLAVANAMAANGDFDDGIILAIPLVGTLYHWLFKEETYYRIDSMLMFQKAVHNSVLEVIDAMTAEKGLRALSEADRKPTMREFYGRRAA